MVIVAILVCASFVVYLMFSVVSWISLKSKYESISNLVKHYVNKASGQLWFQHPNYSIREEHSYSCSRNPDDMCKRSACEGCCHAHRIIYNKLVFPDLKLFLSEIKVSSSFLVCHIIRNRIKKAILLRLNIDTNIKEIVNE